MEVNDRQYLNRCESMINPDKIVSFHVPCYVCGELTKTLHNLYTKMNSHKDPYFPFLETYKPPKSACPMAVDGSIAACLCCFAFLHCQWKLYENSRVSYAKRIYWLKRTDGKPFSGIMIGAQSEYASQILGLSSEQISEVLEENIFAVSEKAPLKRSKTLKVECDMNSDFKTQSEALDLSIESKYSILNKNKCQENCYVSKSMDYRIPDKNLKRCSVCGNYSPIYTNKNQSLISLFGLIERNNLYSSKLSLLQSTTSTSLNNSNRLNVCEGCSTKLQLLHQFYTFKNVRDDSRNYYFKGHFSNKKFVICIACNTNIVNQNIQCDVNNSTNNCVSPQKPSFMKQNYCQSSINDIIPKKHVYEDEVVELCCCCLQLICCDPEKAVKLCTSKCGLANKTFEKYYKDRKLFESSISECIIGNGALKYIMSCDLCSNSYNFKDMEKILISHDPDDPDKRIFPSLKYLSVIDSRKISVDFILSCRRCHDILYKQYLTINSFASNYNENDSLLKKLSCLTSIFSEILARTCNNITNDVCAKTLIDEDQTEKQAMIERSVSKRSDGKVHLIESIDIGTTSVSFCYKGGSWEPLLDEYEVMPADRELVKLPLKKVQNPLDIGVNCFICGIFSNQGYTYVVWNKHFNPFKMTKCQNNWKNKEAGLVCSICFHSLISQRQEFENASIPFSERNYVMSWYFCYVCSAGTFRARLHLLPVEAFPFLLKHVTTKKGIVANGGNDVIVCRDCYETLNNQYLEMERLRVPLKMRQYNWIKRPPPEPSLENVKKTSSPVGHKQKNTNRVAQMESEQTPSCSIIAQDTTVDAKKRKIQN